MGRHMAERLGEALLELGTDDRKLRRGLARTGVRKSARSGRPDGYALSTYRLRPAFPLGPPGTPPWHNPGTVGTNPSDGTS